MTEYEPFPRTPLDAEIADGIAESGINGYMRNFRMNLPDGFVREQVTQLGMQDRVLVEEPVQDQDPYSPKSRSTTWGQFFGELDRATENAGIDPVEVQRLQAEEKAALDSGPLRAQLNKLLLPAYRELRLLGYSHADLRR